jgi:integrase
LLAARPGTQPEPPQRWRDVDLDAGTASVRSAGVVRVKGEGASIAEGGTKSGKLRVIDLDAATVTVLRAHRQRAATALQLARDDALVFGDHQAGNVRAASPGPYSRQSAALTCANVVSEGGVAAYVHARGHG